MTPAGRQTVAEKITAIYLVAATASAKPDPTILDYLLRSLADADRVVRRTAVDAALSALWPDLHDPLERVAAGDPDADLRAFAGETLTTLRERGGGPPDRGRSTACRWPPTVGGSSRCPESAMTGTRPPTRCVRNHRRPSCNFPMGPRRRR